MADSAGHAFDNVLLTEIRNRFCHVDSDPYSGRRIYFENAGGALTLKNVVEITAEQTALPDNAGRDNAASRMISETIERGRADLKAILGARSGTVAVGESTTANVFRIVSAFVRSVPGANLVTTNLDHPAVYDSTRRLCEQHGKEWRVAGLSPETGDVPAEAVLSLIDKSTLALCMIHSSNITGGVNDVKTIIQRARKIKPDLYVLVDGAQHGPHAVVDVEDLACDAYTLSSYKMFSKIGGSAAYLSARAACLPHDKLIGKSAETWDLGTREQAAYAGWSAVADYLCWLGGHTVDSGDRRALIAAGMTAANRHERALTHRLLHGTKATRGLLNIEGVAVYGETDDLTRREAVVSVRIKGMTSAEAVSALRARGIRIHNRVRDAYSKHTLDALDIEECLRVSLCHYNSLEEVDTFLAEVGDLARNPRRIAGGATNR